MISVIKRPGTLVAWLWPHADPVPKTFHRFSQSQTKCLHMGEQAVYHSWKEDLTSPLEDTLVEVKDWCLFVSFLDPHFTTSLYCPVNQDPWNSDRYTGNEVSNLSSSYTSQAEPLTCLPKHVLLLFPISLHGTTTHPVPQAQNLAVNPDTFLSLTPGPMKIQDHELLTLLLHYLSPLSSSLHVHHNPGHHLLPGPL